MKLPAYMKEKYRPAYHYTAERDQINDPNGMIYINGWWHLYHQYNLYGAVHWGHAISRDLIHWNHEETALYPDKIDQIWSGSCVIDYENAAGFGKGAVIAVFTYGNRQAQGIAFSTDGGFHFQMYSRNPVLENVDKKDFRDPKVFLWENGVEKRWIMIVAGGKVLDFYGSENLKNWEYLSSWGEEYGEGSYFECPDIFCMPICGEKEENRWVILASLYGEKEPNGGRSVIYAAGEFDGREFHSETQKKQYFNYGMDCYAVQTFFQPKEKNNGGRRIAVSWQDNWNYRELLPTEPFNGQMNLIKELYLVNRKSGLKLIQKPISEYQNILGETVEQGKNHCVYVRTRAEKGDFALKIFDEEKLLLTLLKRGREWTVRRECFNDAELPCFEHTSKVCEEDFVPGWDMELFLDRSSAEFVCQNGGLNISELLLPKGKSYNIKLESGSKHSIVCKEIFSIWNDRPDKMTERGMEWEVESGRWARTKSGLEGSSPEAAILRREKGQRAFRAEAEVTVRGVKNTSMTSILGERFLGFMLDDKRIILDYEKQALIFGKEIRPLKLCKNQFGLLAVEIREENYRILWNGLEILEGKIFKYQGGFGIFAEDALAVFQNLKIKEIG